MHGLNLFFLFYDLFDYITFSLITTEQKQTKNDNPERCFSQ